MKHWAKHLLSFAILSLFLAFNTATSPAKKSTPRPISASANDSEDIDAASLYTLLKCGPSNQGCRVLKEFSTASSPKLSEGKSLYFGQSYAIGGTADGQTDLFSLHINKTGSWVQGLAFAVIPSTPTETTDANNLLSIVKASGTAKPDDPTVSFLKTQQPSNSLTQTDSVSKVMQSHKYIRQAGDRLLVIEYSSLPLSRPKTTQKASAWCSELWLVK